MATKETIYKGSNGRYYTADGLADFMEFGNPSSSFKYTEVSAVRYTITVRLMDADAGVIFNTQGTAKASMRSVRTIHNFFLFCFILQPPSFFPHIL